MADARRRHRAALADRRRYAEEIARALGLPEPHTQFDPQVVEAFLTVLTHDRKTRGRIGVRVA